MPDLILHLIFYKHIYTMSPSAELIFISSQCLLFCLYFFIELISFIKSLVLISIDGHLLFIILMEMVAVNRFNISSVGKMIPNFLFSDLITTFILFYHNIDNITVSTFNFNQFAYYTAFYHRNHLLEINIF